MKWNNTLTYVILFLFLLAIPLFVKGEYYLHVLILCAINIILASSLRTLATTGQMSLGHIGFMSVGAYTSGILVTKVGLPVYVGIILGGVGAMLLAAIIAYPITRVKTIYFSMLTLFLAEVVRLVFTEGRDITGGTSGLIGIPRLGTISIPGLFTIEFTSRMPNYYFALFLMVLVLLFLYSIDRSYIGMTFKSLAQDDSLAASIGIDVAKFKAIVLCCGCFVAGLAGSFYAHYMSVISPDSFGLFQSLYVMIYITVGGPKRFWGPAIGALILTIVPEIFRMVKEYQPFIFGGVLYLVVYLLPGGGLIDLPDRIKLAIKTSRGKGMRHA
jgi:branched-chain amino acid transport system permease protein